MESINIKRFFLLVLLNFFVYFLYAYNRTHKIDKSFPSFENVFKQKGIITLSQKKSIIGNIRSLQIDEQGYLWLLDSKVGNVKKYDQRGNLIFSLGRKGEGPGEFELPLDFFLSKYKIYIIDPMRRLLSIFNKNGNFEDSFKIKDGRQVKLDKEGEKIIISAPWVKSEKEGYCIHIYNKEGKLVKSFFPIANIVLKNNMKCDWTYFDLDRENYIYAVQEMEYKIFKYSVNGDLSKTFSKINSYYSPPPSELFKEFYLREALEKWIKSWTHVAGIYVSNNLLIVNLRNFEPEEYIIDIYDLNGNFILGGLKTSYRMLCSDQRGNIYFLSETEKGFKIIFNIFKTSIYIPN